MIFDSNKITYLISQLNEIVWFERLGEVWVCQSVSVLTQCRHCYTCKSRRCLADKLIWYGCIHTCAISLFSFMGSPPVSLSYIICEWKVNLFSTEKKDEFSRGVQTTLNLLQERFPKVAHILTGARTTQVQIYLASDFNNFLCLIRQFQKLAKSANLATVGNTENLLKIGDANSLRHRNIISS